LTFTSCTEQKQNIINKNPHTQSIYNAYITLPGQIVQGGKIHIPVKSSHKHHGSLKHYYKKPSKNGIYQTTYSIIFYAKNKLKIALTRKKEAEFVIGKTNFYGTDVNVKHNLFCDKYNNTIDFGASTTYKDFMPGKLEGNQTAISNITQSEPFSNRAVSEQGVFEHALYISNQQKISEDLSFKYGIRASLYQDLGGHWVYSLNNYQVADSFYVDANKTYANAYSVEPRLGINYRVSENSSLKASYTYTTQQDQLLMKTNGGGPLDIWFPSDNNIKPQTASQYSLGYLQYFLDNLF